MSFQNTLIGKGIKFRFNTDYKGGLELEESIARINQSLWILFDTRKGSKILQPDFGSSIHELRFDPLDAILLDQLEYHIRNDISAWEKRIEVISIDFQDSEELRENNTLIITINYKIINTNVEGNFVYPFQYGPRYLHKE